MRSYQAVPRPIDPLVVAPYDGRLADLQADWAPLVDPAALLPRVRAAVGPELPLLVDGGIRRGSDVLKALALGADAVLLGRPYIHALATAGALGVARALRLLRDEFEIAMALCGCKTLADIGPAQLWRAELDAGFTRTGGS